MEIHYLNQLFAPQHIAVIGASDRPRSVGQTVFVNLLSGTSGIKLSPVNLRHKIVGGMAAVATIKELPTPPDVVVVATPPASYAEVLKNCHEVGVPYVVLITAQEDASDDDRHLIAAAIRQAKQLGIRLIGPSLLGLMRPAAGLNIGTYRGNIAAGNIALISQSSGLCSAILDWGSGKNIGFSTVLSFGENSGTLGFGEVLDFLVNDKATRGIVLHIHRIGNGRKLMSALRAAARVKPVVVIKSGRAEERVADAALHVADTVHADEVFSRVLARAGVLQVKNFAQMFSAVRTLAADYRTGGERLAIVTNGQGLGVMAADAASDSGVTLAAFSEKTCKAMSNALSGIDIGNPLDLRGDAGALRFRTAVKLCLDDAATDGVLVVFSPQSDNNDEHLKTAEMMVQLQKETGKPLLLSWLGGEKVAASRALFARHGALQFGVPEYAVEVFRSLVQFYRNQRLLMQIPAPANYRRTRSDVTEARHLIAEARAKQRYILPEHLSKKLLACFHIESNYTDLAQSPQQAADLADTIGYPVVLKIDSPNIFHKANVGGVRLNIKNREELETAYEEMTERIMVMAPQAVINGVSVQAMLSHYHVREVKISVAQDATFGPIIVFAAGGDAAIQQDRALALPPLSDVIIDDLIGRTRISRTFGHYKNMQPIDHAALHEVLARVSELVCELPEVSELKIDLLVSPQGAIASDVRLIINNDDAPARCGHMAIMPYPHYLEKTLSLKNGTPVLIRPVREVDGDMIQTFVRNLSEESRYNRFMSNIKELSDNVLVRFTQLDYDRDIGLAMVRTLEDGSDEAVGIARYVTDPDMQACEFAVSVADDWQGNGIASILMNHLFLAAREQGLKIMRGEVLADNQAMQGLVRKLGFTVEKDPSDDSITIVVKDLWADNTAETPAPAPKAPARKPHAAKN
ncbi:MAG: GNAT family N-acetyltransferase [Neisseria sp.]|nr:GNAT family N-acetyltransferase [Neisseria sp.]